RVRKRELYRRGSWLRLQARNSDQPAEIVDHRKHGEREQILLRRILNGVAHQRFSIGVQIDQQTLDLRGLQRTSGRGLESSNHVRKNQTRISAVGIVDKYRCRQ